MKMQFATSHFGPIKRKRPSVNCRFVDPWIQDIDAAFKDKTLQKKLADIDRTVRNCR
jgi:hypothetical protein